MLRTYSVQQEGDSEKGISPRRDFVGTTDSFLELCLRKRPQYLAIPLESGECVSTGKSNKEESRVGRSEEEFVIFSSFGHHGLNA